MFFFRRSKKSPPEAPPPAQPSGRVGISLAADEFADAPASSAEVQRISPTELRLALPEEPPEAFAAGMQLNRRVDLMLPLPAPHQSTVTRARIVGITHNYNPGDPPVVLDVEFMDLSDDEQKALRESHPGLLVS